MINLLRSGAHTLLGAPFGTGNVKLSIPIVAIGSVEFGYAAEHENEAGGSISGSTDTNQAVRSTPQLHSLSGEAADARLPYRDRERPRFRWFWTLVWVLRFGEHLADIVEDQAFASLYQARGRNAILPSHLAMVTVSQFVEKVPDEASLGERAERSGLQPEAAGQGLGGQVE